MRKLFLPLFASLSFYPAANAVPECPPNIVLILSDDQSYTDYSFMGHRAH